MKELLENMYEAAKMVAEKKRLRRTFYPNGNMGYWTYEGCETKTGGFTGSTYPV